MIHQVVVICIQSKITTSTLSHLIPSVLEHFEDTEPNIWLLPLVMQSLMMVLRADDDPSPETDMLRIFGATHDRLIMARHWIHHLMLIPKENQQSINPRQKDFETVQPIEKHTLL